MATLRETAEKAGFSISVVSRALSRNPDKNARVAVATRRLIEKAAQEVGYRPNRAAEFLRRGSAPTLGIFLPRIADRLIAELVFGVAEEAEAQGFPQSFSFGMTARQYREFIAGTRDIAHCAIITYPYGDGGRWTDDPQQSTAVVGEFTSAGGKVVLINALAPVEGVPVVSCDDYEGGRLAAQRLLAADCRQFVLVHPYWGRTEGFTEALGAAGRKAHLVAADAGGMAALSRVAERARLRDLPLGVFATQDLYAVRALNVLRATRLRVGQEALLIGYDDYWIGEELEPALTTIHQPFEEVGRIAVRKAINQIYGKAETSEKVSPCLVARRSA